MSGRVLSNTLRLTVVAAALVAGTLAGTWVIGLVRGPYGPGVPNAVEVSWAENELRQRQRLLEFCEAAADFQKVAAARGVAAEVRSFPGWRARCAPVGVEVEE